MSDEIISLREFMDLKFHGIERELANLRSAFERIALEMVTRQQFDRVIGEVDALRGKVDVLEKRLIRQDANMRVIQWLGGTVATVTMYLVVAYLRSLLGV